MDMNADKLNKQHVDEINKGRETASEYRHLFPILKKQPDKFVKYMRMQLSTFEYILTKVDPVLKKNWCNLHQQPIKSEEKLVITIRFLATGVSYGHLSFSFRMAKSTISYLIEEVLNALWNQLCHMHMPIPTQDMFMDIAQDFYLLWDIPHCVGSIDVRHIKIKKPPHSGSTYFNYKKFFSITLQAVVDAHCRFISIDVGGYGHQHDATTFRASTFYKALKANKLQLPEDDELYKSRTILPYFLIGDGAYPLSANLIKPYPGKQLSENQRLFNKRLSRARVTVECAFGRLCQKWRIFYTTIEHPPKKAELIVKSSCILHNIIIDLEKPTTLNLRQSLSESSILEADERENEQLTGNGEMIRSKLIDFFLENPVQDWEMKNL